MESIFGTGNNYYPRVFLKECIYVVKETKMSKSIIDDLDIFSDSDEENSDLQISDEKNLKNSHIVKLIFKAYKIFFDDFFSMCKILTGYYQKNKESLSNKVCERYQNLSEEEKNKKHQYAR